MTPADAGVAVDQDVRGWQLCGKSLSIWLALCVGSRLGTSFRHTYLKFEPLRPAQTVQWYLDNLAWRPNVQDGDYQRERLEVKG